MPKHQQELVSGTNIKTINGNSLLGSGDIPIAGGSGGAFLKEEFTYSASQTFTLTNSYSGILIVTVNGRELYSSQYTKPTNTTVTILDTLETGDTIAITYNIVGDILGDMVTALDTINGQII
jgi:hypothetical protein